MNGVRLGWRGPLTISLMMVALLLLAVNAWAAPSLTAIDPGRALLGLACPAAGQCTAVDDGGREVTFNPTAAVQPDAEHDRRQQLPDRRRLSVCRASAPPSTTRAAEVTFNPDRAGHHHAEHDRLQQPPEQHRLPVGEPLHGG